MGCSQSAPAKPAATDLEETPAEKALTAAGHGAEPGDGGGSVERRKALSACAKLLLQTDEEIQAEITEKMPPALFDKGDGRGPVALKPGEDFGIEGAPKILISRPSYKKARKLLRTTEKWVKGPTADKAELVGEQTGPFEGFVELSVLRKNVDAYRKLLEKLIAWEPDCVIGTMRGGAFLLDVLEVGKGGAELKDIMLRPEKIKPRQAFQQALCELVDDLITKGKRRIVFVDAYMGGFNAEATLEKIFIPNLNKHAASSSGFFGGAEKPLALATFWIRETFGLEKWAGFKRYMPNDLPHKLSLPSWECKYLECIGGEECAVPWIFGDDVNAITEGVDTTPLHVFDEHGVVRASFAPREGETTRGLAIRMLQGEAEATDGQSLAELLGRGSVHV